jgi:hypothetical protein
MAIKHSKFRNTAILFELLVRQTTSDLLQNKDSKSVRMLKKYFTGTELGKEYNLYSAFNTTEKLNEVKSEMFISTVLDQRKQLDQNELNRLKYNLIREIKNNYDIDNFFKAKIENYKIYASIYTIFESIHVKSTDTKSLLLNKINLLEHISVGKPEDKTAPQSILEEFMKEDKEIRLLAYKIMVEKFNSRYKHLSDRQKSVLKEYINNISETENLKKYINGLILELKSELLEIKETIEDKVTYIKLTETIKLLKPIKQNQFVKDENISAVLQYIELIEELKHQK